MVIGCPTLYRFAVLELQFGQTATTIPVLDGAGARTANSYAKVSALLLGAIPNLKVLRQIESAAISSLQEQRGAP